MAGESELLSAVLERPEDLQARLVYADFLQDQGDERGVFIAQQCRLASLDDLSPEQAPLLASTRRLQVRHGADWTRELREQLTGRPRRPLFPQFRRGFVERLALGVTDVESHWEWLRARLPLSGVELSLNTFDQRRTKRLGAAESWRELKLRGDGYLSIHNLYAFLSGGLHELRRLDLSGCALSLRSQQPVLMNQELPFLLSPLSSRTTVEEQLTELRLRGCLMHDDDLREVLRLQLTRLERLDVSRNHLSPEILGEFARAPCTRQLRHLNLSGNDHLGGRLHRLRGWPVPSQLRSLGLPRTLSKTDWQALFPDPSSNLRALYLSGARELAREDGFLPATARALTHLVLAGTRLGDEAFVAFIESMAAAPLVYLDAGACSLSDRAIFALTASSSVSLVDVDLSSNRLSDDALIALARWPALANLVTLRVGNNRRLTSRGFRALAEAPHFDPVLIDVGNQSEPAIVELLQQRFSRALLHRNQTRNRA